MHANALPEGKTDKEKIDPAGFIQALIKIDTDHSSNTKNSPSALKTRERSTAHMMVLFSFIGLFIVTNIFCRRVDFSHRGALPPDQPGQMAGQHQRHRPDYRRHFAAEKPLAKKDQISSYWDWYLVGLVLALGVTGMGPRCCAWEDCMTCGLHLLSAPDLYLEPVCLHTVFQIGPHRLSDDGPWPTRSIPEASLVPFLDVDLAISLLSPLRVTA
jgi:quinone-modifying oxidoreductase subunit QmoC